MMIADMEQIISIGVLALFGLMFGSFVGASVWRLRARQLVEDKNAGESVDKKEYAQLLPLTKQGITADRSRCLHCGTTLKWHDLLPLVSWLSTGGRCRYCKARIGTFEPLIELGVATLFVVSYIVWPVPLLTMSGLVVFLLWLAAVVLLAILFAYDLKWFLLPDTIVFPLIGIGAVTSIVHVVLATDKVGVLISIAGASLILSGLYYFLWRISKGEWVGFGDVKLGLGLALLLADWRLASVTLFSANLIGCLVVLPGMLSGRLGRKTHIPFGPLLIAGAVVAMLVGGRIIQSYIELTF